MTMVLGSSPTGFNGTPEKFDGFPRFPFEINPNQEIDLDTELQKMLNNLETRGGKAYLGDLNIEQIQQNREQYNYEQKKATLVHIRDTVQNIVKAKFNETHPNETEQQKIKFANSTMGILLGLNRWQFFYRHYSLK